MEGWGLALEIIAERDLRELKLLGRMLDGPHQNLDGRSMGLFLAESLLRVRGKDGRVVPLRANAAQREFERRRGLRNIVLKARQMGITTWVAGRFLLKTVTQPGTLTLQVAHTQQAAEEILRIVHRFVEHLPEGLRRGALKTGKQNVREIVFPAIDSEYRVVSAADRNAGRGMTVQNLHCSEVSRWGGAGAGDAAEILAGLRAGLTPGGELVLESTPNGAEGCFYDEWQRAGEFAAGDTAAGTESKQLVRHFFPWWIEAGYRAQAAVREDTLSDQERRLIEEEGLDLSQIGYRREMQASLRGLAMQEMAEDAESCFRVSGEMYFDQEAVEDRLLRAPEPVMREWNGQLERWLPPVAGRRYVVAVDPAGGGTDGDWSAMEVVDVETGMQCAEFAGHVAGRELSDRAAQLGREYNLAWIAVERNNHGSGVLALLESNARYTRIWRGADGQPGWLTTSVSRPRLLGQLGAALVESPELFLSRRLLAECRSFVRLPGGGMGARSGAHDDRVMAMAIALEARAEMLGRRAEMPGTSF